MDAMRGLHYSQYENPDWDAAITLVALSIVPVVHSHSHSHATAAAASEVSTKLDDGVRSRQYGKMGGASKSQKAKNGLQAISSSQHGKMESDSKSEEVETDSDGSVEEVVSKKPGPLLPCPRCNSIETKFCYYNNYNINQPRHYCRRCQRYWTVGGRTRNVPIGSGRRTNNKKSSLHATKLLGDIRPHRYSAFKPPGILQGSAKQNEAMTTPGSEVALRMSLSPMSNTKEQKKNTDLVSLGSDVSKEEKSCLSSAVLSGSSEDSMAEKEASDISGYSNVKEPTLHTESYPAAGPALVFPYSSGSNNAAIMANTQFSTDGTHGLENSEASLLSLLPPMVPAPGIHAPADPFPQESVFWNFTPGLPSGAWNEPWAGTGSSGAPNFIAYSGSDSLAIGKHPREANAQEGNKAGKTFWVPKTLRVTNPDEAAKSSIWASMKIKPDWRLFSKRPLRNGKKPKPPQFLQARSRPVRKRT